jgi:ParB/RepB/Spo0J family partition protein
MEVIILFASQIKTGNTCTIEELDLKTIRHNKILSIAIRPKDVDRCAKTIRQYGLLTPLIVRPCKDGGYMVIAGECELKALREVGLKKAEVVIVNCHNKVEADKISLILSSLRQAPTPLSEGLILKNLMGTGNYNQADIAHLVGKSVSWVSKRLTLIERLNENVLKLVTSQKLSCHTAQEIARLPDDVQLRFATRVVKDSLPKSKVEKLVVVYNNPGTLGSLKENVLDNPQGTLELLPKLMPEIKKVRSEQKKKPPAAEDRIYTSLRLMIKIIGEVELQLAGVKESKKPEQFSGFLQKAGEYAWRFYQLVRQFSPGKINENGGKECGH